MAHRRQKRRFCLAGFFCFRPCLSVFYHQFLQFSCTRFDLRRQLFAVAIQCMNIAAKRIHQPPDGIQLPYASGFRERGVNITVQQPLQRLRLFGKWTRD